MALAPQPAKFSVLEPQSTNVFTGLWRAVCCRDLLLGSMAFAGVLSRLLPLLLPSIPFASAQTFTAHEICTWGAIAILFVLVVTLLVYMWLATTWPEMPVSPDSLAGCAYYVCDSAMLRDFERLSMLEARERDRRVERMERRYRFGWMTGDKSGKRRIGVDYAEGERGFKLRSMGTMGFGVMPSKKERRK